MILEEIRNLEASQQPTWPDLDHLNQVTVALEQKPPLIGSHAIDYALEEMGCVARGEAFLLQAGDCAERIDDPPDSVKHVLELMLPMTVALMYGGGQKVVKVARVAGQATKPRSSDTEERDGLVLPSYRGDLVNGSEFSENARTADPERMLRFYDIARDKLQKLDDLTHSELANLEHANQWNVDFSESLTDRERYEQLVSYITKAIDFMKAVGIDINEARHAEVFTSHEALLLPYELALTRIGDDKKPYGSSAHMLWIGERTRKIDQAHVAFCATIKNPIGVKIGPTATEEDVLGLCERLNPERIPGRLTLIARMGAQAISTSLPPLLKAVRAMKYPVIWSSDPMHGNTINGPNGRKTRVFDTIYDELEQFVTLCHAQDVWPGGVHLEATGESVTECLGGSEPTSIKELETNYETACDPRLNLVQALELAFLLAKRLSR